MQITEGLAAPLCPYPYRRHFRLGPFCPCRRHLRSGPFRPTVDISAAVILPLTVNISAATCRIARSWLVFES